MVTEPFQMVAMDIVGPLQVRKSLQICDYATRYPKAILLRFIDAEHVAEESVRVGVPKEILTKVQTLLQR